MRKEGGERFLKKKMYNFFFLKIYFWKIFETNKLIIIKIFKW